MGIDQNNGTELSNKPTRNGWFSSIVCFSLLLLFVGIIGNVLLPFLFSVFLHKNLFLAEGKETYELWEKTPIPVTFKVYIFNVTNPDEVTNNGALPHVQDVGPFVFKQYRSKNVLSWNAEDKTVTYNDLKQYHFVPSSSKSLDEKVYSVNLPLQGILAFTKRLAFFASTVVNPALELLFVKHREKLFVHRTARELLFDGYKVAMIEDLQLLLKPFMAMPEMIPNNTFGFLYGKNNSGDGIFTVFTGEDDIRKYAQIARWNNQSEIPFWKDTFCNMINGTDGSQFSPPVTKKDALYVYTPEMCRSVYLEYEADVEVRGIPAYRFVTPERLFASPFQNPDNMCYCTEEQYCSLSGILDASPCRNGLKLAVTAPHFYLAHESIRGGVTGLHPSKDAHQTYLDVEPDTGIVLRAARRLQMNFIMQPVKTFSQTQNVGMGVIPLIWVVEEAEINSELADLFNARVRTPVAIAKAVLVACMVLGVLWIASAGSVSFYLHRKHERAAELALKRESAAVAPNPEHSNKTL